MFDKDRFIMRRTPTNTKKEKIVIGVRTKRWLKMVMTKNKKIEIN